MVTMCDGEYRIACKMCDGNELNVMDGASRDEISVALDCLAMDAEDGSLWLAYRHGRPILINPKYIVYAEMRD